MNEEDLKSILVSSEGSISILKQYMDDFGGYNITLNVEDESLSEIAKLASEEKTGAPRLLTILEKVLRDFKF